MLLSLVDQYDRHIGGYTVVLPGGKKVQVQEQPAVSLGFFPKGEHTLHLQNAAHLEKSSLTFQVLDQSVAVSQKMRIVLFQQKGRVTDL